MVCASKILCWCVRVRDVYQAINLEGDASSTMVRKVGENDFQLMNQPSEGKEKDVANGLQVIVKQ